METSETLLVELALATRRAAKINMVTSTIQFSSDKSRKHAFVGLMQLVSPLTAKAKGQYC